MFERCWVCLTLTICSERPLQLYACAMHCILLSMLTGKSGHVATRLSSSLSSLGIPSQFVHAAEWGHGDLGGWRHGMTLSR